MTLFSHSFYIGFRLFVLLERCSDDVSSMPSKVRGTLVSWANSSVGSRSCPTSPAAPPCASIRPARGMSGLKAYVTGFSLDHLGMCALSNLFVESPVESKTRTYHGRVGSRRTAGWRARLGRTGCQQNCSPRRLASLVSSKASKTRRLNISPEARTSEILCKPNSGTKSPVDGRFIRGLSLGREALFAPCC